MDELLGALGIFGKRLVCNRLKKCWDIPIFSRPRLTADTSSAE
jgi:hypothetical protein